MGLLSKAYGKKKRGATWLVCYHYDMKHPIEFGTAITILLAITIVACGAVWYGIQSANKNYSTVSPTSPSAPSMETSAPAAISEDQALNIVANLPDVKNWIALFTGPNQTDPQTGGTPVLEVG